MKRRGKGSISNENLEEGITILMKYKSLKNTERKARVNHLENDTNKNIIGKLILVLLLIVTSILIYLFFEYAPILGIKIFNTEVLSIDTIENIDYSDTQYFNYLDKLLVVTDRDILLYDVNGNEEWEYKFDREIDPDVIINGDKMVISDKSTSTVYLFRGKSHISITKLEETILNTYLDNNGMYIVETTTSGYKKVLYVFDQHGNQKNKIIIENNIIIYAKIIDNSSKLLIVEASTDNLNIATIIKTITLDSTNISENIILELENEIAVNVNSQDDSLRILTDKRVIDFNIMTGEYTEMINMSDESVNFVEVLPTHLLTISTDKSVHYYSTYNFNLEKISNIVVENLPKQVISSEFISYLVTEDKILIYNKWGIYIGSYDITYAPRDIIIIDESKTAVLVYSSKIEFIRL